MSYTVVAIDRDALPTALLPAAKQQCRVTFPDDDEIIKTHIAIAIAWCQKAWELQVFATVIDWRPVSSAAYPSLGAYPLPVQPVSDFKVTAGGVDVSADYSLRQPLDLSARGFLVTNSGEPFPADAEVELNAGYADQTEIPPEMLGPILRITATLYEDRESVVAYSINEMPGWANDWLTGLWVARA